MRHGKGDPKELERQIRDIAARLAAIPRTGFGGPIVSPVPDGKAAVQFGFYEREPVQVLSGTTTATTWASVDCKPYVPVGAQSVILQVYLYTHGDPMLYQYRSSGLCSAKTIETRATGAGDETSIRVQVVVQLTQDQHFEHQVVVSAGTTGWQAFEAHVIGWFGPEDQRQPR